MNNANKERVNRAAFGVYRSRAEMEAGMQSLRAQGFNKSEISVLLPERKNHPDLSQRQKTLIKTGATVGGVIGGAVFFVVSLLVSLQAIVVPGLETASSMSERALIVICGLITGMAAGAGAGALVGIGTPQPAAQRYGSYVKGGGLLLSVHVRTDDDGRKAMDVLEATGANEINVLAESENWETVYNKVYSGTWTGNWIVEIRN